jgi:thiamine-monophosphate kinase
MLDISDGLSLDLWRMCEASGVGAQVDQSLLTGIATEAARTLAEMDGHTALEHVLADGEDFELLMAVAPDRIPSAAPVFPVGEIVRSGFSLRAENGAVHALQPAGYVH